MSTAYRGPGVVAVIHVLGTAHQAYPRPAAPPARPTP
jgi:hypothetical protein